LFVCLFVYICVYLTTLLSQPALFCEKKNTVAISKEVKIGWQIWQNLLGRLWLKKGRFASVADISSCIASNDRVIGE
jgi:hypothetical protein